MRRIMYTSVNAQADNLGDVLIRQAMLDILAQSCDEIVIYTGSQTQDYLEAYDFPSNSTLVRTTRQFCQSMVLSILRGRAEMALPPGPARLSDKALELARLWMQLLIARLINGSGGRVISIGRAYGGSGPLARSITSKFAGISSAFSVRDMESARQLHLDVDVLPDLAFMHELRTQEDEARDLIAVSLRADRDVYPRAIVHAVERAREHGLNPIFVSQVGRDDECNEHFARLTKSEMVLWEKRPHRRQMQRVVDVYSRAQIVLTNRLHGALWGAAHGAIPVSATGIADKKLSSTLGRVVTVVNVDTTEGAGDPDLSEFSSLLENLEARRKTMLCEFADARMALNDWLISHGLRPPEE